MTPAQARQWGRGDTRRITTSAFPAAVVALVEERQGGRFCENCRTKPGDLPPGQKLELDHRIPLARGGDNHWFNLALLCTDCNKGKGDRSKPPAVPLWARGYPGDRKG
jgi:hypothetical protein